MNTHPQATGSYTPRLLIGRAPIALALAIVLLGTLAIFGSLNLTLAIVAFAWGAIAFPFVLVSWRFHSSLSWLLWAVPVPAAAAYVLSFFVLSVAIPLAMFHLLAGGLLGFFSLLRVFRPHVQRFVP